LAVAVVAVLGTMAVTAAAAGPKIKMLDECDPVTFNSIGLGVICDTTFDGSVTFPEFAALLSPAAFGHPAWRFDAPYLEIQRNEKVHVKNDGGEDHTFTEVSAFGGGRVEVLNMPLGLTALPECSADVAPLIRPGASVQIKGLSEGIHLIECCIHPWMHAVIEVRPGNDKDHRHH
jgi:hypothetical protein